MYFAKSFHSKKTAVKIANYCGDSDTPNGKHITLSIFGLFAPLSHLQEEQKIKVKERASSHAH